MIPVELNSNGQLFKLLEVSKFCVGVEHMGAHTEGKEHRLPVCGKRVLRGYLYLIGKKLEEMGANCLMGSFMICSPCGILVE